MGSVMRRLLFTVALLIGIVMLWQRMHIVVFVQASLWQLLAVLLVLAVAIYLTLEAIVERLERR